MHDQTKHTDAFQAVSTVRRNLDKSVKRILAQKPLVAACLKHLFPEHYRNMTVAEIMDCIGEIKQDQTLDDIPEHSVTGSEKTKMRNTVETESNGEILFDSLFDAVLPVYDKSGQTVLASLNAIIDIEVQNTASQMIYLAARIRFYDARAVSMQKNLDFLNDEYQNLKPVRSVWIMPTSSEEYCGTLKTVLESLYPDSTIEKKLQEAFSRLFETVVIFFNPKSIHSNDPQIRFMANLFFQNDRKKIQEFLVEEGIPVTEETVKSISEFSRHFFTLDDDTPEKMLKSALEIDSLRDEVDEQKGIIAKKDEVITQKDEVIAHQSDALAQKDEVIAQMGRDMELLKTQTAQQLAIKDQEMELYKQQRDQEMELFKKQSAQEMELFKKQTMEWLQKQLQQKR